MGMKTSWLAPLAGALLILAGCGDSGEQRKTATPGVDLVNKVLTIGALNDESGPAAVIGKPYALGKRLLVAEINAGGSGLLPEGWTVKLIERDHGYNPQRSVQALNEIRDDILFLATSFGTPNTLPLRPKLKQHDIVAFPASLSSKMAEFEYTPPLGPSYIVEAMRAMDYAITSEGKAADVRAGIIYQNDDYGKDGHDGWKAAAKFHGVPIVAAESYAPGQADFTAAVTALKKAGATHVLLSVLPSATSPILGAALQIGFRPIWIGNAPAWSDRFFDPQVMPPEVMESLHFVAGTAVWGEAVPIMDRLQAAYDKYAGSGAPPGDSYVLISYAQGLMGIEAFRRALEAGEVSRKGFLKALRSLTAFDGGGMWPDPIDLSRLPYVPGLKTRVLKPNPETKRYDVLGNWAEPSRAYGN